MSRSRTNLIRFVVPAAALLVGLAFATPAFAETSTPWSPKLAYVLTTGSVRSVLVEKLHLTKAQDQQLRAIGFDLERAQEAVQRKSDLIVMDDGRTLEEKQAAIAAIGYNGTLESAEASAVARAAAVTGLSADALGVEVSQVWQEDAAEHNLQTSLTAMGLTPQALVGSFHVYATRFYDQYGTTFGVAIPDRYVKFASNDTRYAPGYPDGTYAVSLYWDGVHHGRDNNQNATWSGPHSVASAKVVDVGPWNLDDNYWNSYSDPARPRRINNSDNKNDAGNVLTALAGLPHLAFGLPESQAAYFNYYGRPAKIPAHTTSPENYWDKPRGYKGQWSGADEYGRQVTQPAAIDLCPPVYAAMGMTDNEWIDMVPLWESRLDLVGSVKTTAGPYITGQKVSFTFTLKNGGTLSGNWDAVTVTLVSPKKMTNATYQGPFSLGPGATKSFTFTHTLEDTGTAWARINGEKAYAWSRVGTTDITLGNVALRTVDRLSGATRYDTAVQISKSAYPKGASTVVVATGLDYPDALTGAVLAHAKNAPLLLVGKTAPASVMAEVKRLKPTSIVVLGGPSAVGTAALSQVTTSAPGATVLRLAGKDRYATARLIAQEVVKLTGNKTPGGTAIVASGHGFADAMAASAMAAEKGWPILLTDKSKIPTDTSLALTSISATNTLVVGGSSMVATSVLTALPKATRLSGATRYDTAAAIADYAESKGVLNYAYVGLAYGGGFPDGLAGAVLAACNKGVMLLTPDDYLVAATKTRLQKHRTVTTHLQVYGSTKAVSAEALTAATDALR